MAEPRSFQAFFSDGTGHGAPRPWQARLADPPACGSRLIRIPTGLGKTLGVLSAWAWHRLERGDPGWPRRLAWCLPMRTLTEQTAREAEAFLEASGHGGVRVHTLMGGADAGDWVQHPERPAVLVGTQDMLLSAALNRGYGAGRAAWPRAMGLLHTDCLWVADEVQLMDVGLATTGQLQAFSEHPGSAGSPPRCTWWMSATLQPRWLSTPETQPWLPALEEGIHETDRAERTGPAWSAAKPLRVVRDPHNAAAVAEQAVHAHRHHAAGPGGSRQTLLVVNRVMEAQEVYERIRKAAPEGVGVHLLHSRFRPHERAAWSEELLRKAEPGGPGGPVDRILVATQVVEAGVDISATCLLTRLAPWPCLVQRFGRAARYGGSAEVVVLAEPPTDKAAAPYSAGELEAAAAALTGLGGVGLGELLDHEAAVPDSTLRTLYPYRPEHVLVEREWEELFDTSADLAGGDLDAGRFIRSGEDRDVLVFWRDEPAGPAKGSKPGPEVQPRRDELCRVPIADAGKWLKDGGPAWAWSFTEGAWERLGSSTKLRPGAVVLADTRAGGYDPALGFTGSRKAATAAVPGADQTEPAGADDRADAGERLSASGASGASGPSGGFQTIATHGLIAAEEAVAIAGSLGLPAEDRDLLHLTLRLHDWGKAHPAFACCIHAEPQRGDLAKAPGEAWVPLNRMYRPGGVTGDRPRFRHELASALAVLCWVAEERARRAAEPDAAAGGRRPPPHPALGEALRLDGRRFDLLLYLLASHHGKVRGSLLTTEADRAFRPPAGTGGGLPVRGVRTGDRLPATRLCDARGDATLGPEVRLDTSVAGLGLSERLGRSWADRVAGLLRSEGPARLAWLEAIVRAADARASARVGTDPLLADEPVRVAPAPDPQEAPRA